jgi:alkylhydroperoxidase/carboxymuconolactone decarboxylase family protein YurZ
MPEEAPKPTDERIHEWVMGDETSRTRMQVAGAGSAGETQREVIGSRPHDIWDRRVLPIRTMALMNLAILASINRPYELYTRTLGLLRGGISVEEIREVFLHVTIYVGNPAGVEAIVALHQAIESLKERGIPFNETRVD